MLYRFIPTCLCLATACLLARPVVAEDDHRQVEFQVEGSQHVVTGRVAAEDQQGGLCLQTDSGHLVLVQSDELLASRTVPRAFEPVDREEMTRRLQEELGDRFQVHTTPHYVVAYSTSREFARWLSSMLERLHKAFVNYWQRQGIDLDEPEFPLVVIVYADQAAYRQATSDDLGGASGVIGYYSLKTNRVNMYDLTGAERLRAQSGGRSSLRDINRMLRQPAATPLVATVVHEATHQVAFNTGLMARYADLPLWYMEGMAIYFEAPDLSSSRRWQGIGKVNYPRLGVFRSNQPRWSEDKLRTLLLDDKSLRIPATAGDSYANAWALTYYLMKHRPKEYNAYTKLMSKKKPFDLSSKEERLEEFESHFGSLEQVNREFLRKMSRVD